MKKYGFAVLAILVGLMVSTSYAGNSGISSSGLFEATVRKIITFLDTVASSDSTLNGETIADDTIDDDSIDFTDVTLDDLSGSLTGVTGPFQQTATGADGWSYNLVSLTSAGAGANLRGWRVNMTTPAAATNGDMQNVHGYLTLGATPTVAASAAMSPLSGWLEMPDSVTFAGAAVISGARVIFDANNNALGSAAAGVEAAIIYGQTWASAGTVDAGLFIAAGAGTTIDSLIETGGSGTVGVLLDVRSMQTAGYADALLTIVRGGPQDATAQTHWGMFAGDQTTRSAVAAEVGAASAGSVYYSTAGKIYICTAQPSTWQLVTATAAD